MYQNYTSSLQLFTVTFSSLSTDDNVEPQNVTTQKDAPDICRHTQAENFSTEATDINPIQHCSTSDQGQDDTTNADNDKLNMDVGAKNIETVTENRPEQQNKKKLHFHHAHAPILPSLPAVKLLQVIQL